MSDVTVVASSVAPANASTTIVRATAGAAVSAGQAVYADPAANFTIKPAQATNQAQATNVVGIALDSAAVGQPVAYASAGDVQFNNTPLTPAAVYVLSAANAGGIAPTSDLVTGNYATLLGIAAGANVLRLGVTITNVTKP